MFETLGPRLKIVLWVLRRVRQHLPSQHEHVPWPCHLLIVLPHEAQHATRPILYRHPVQNLLHFPLSLACLGPLAPNAIAWEWRSRHRPHAKCH